MTIFKKSIAAAVVIGLTAGIALAGSHAKGPHDAAIKARQAKMKLYAFNLGILGAMAKGEADYDAAAAGTAASNLMMLTSVFMPAAWPPGSDNASVEGTDALPAMWEAKPEEVGAKAQALSDAAKQMAAVAGTDLDGLRGAIGAVGQACGGCHKAYRAEN